MNKNKRQRIERIKHLINAMGLSQKELEARTGLAYATIYRLMKDIGEPRNSTLFLIEHTFGLDIERFK